MKQNKQNSLKFGLLIAIITSSFTGFFYSDNSNYIFNSGSEVVSEIPENKVPTQPIPSALPSTSKYSRERATDYAYIWWDGANTALYNDYSGSGGDCANFVSQCLIAGGLSLHKGTNGDGYGVYPDTPRPSQNSYGTIPYCDFLNTHLRNYQHTSVTFVNEATAYIPDEITIGDVIIFGEDPGDNWEHAMVVIWDNGTFDLGLAGHSSQVWNRSFWTEIGYSSFDCATFYHIEDESTENYHFKVTTSGLNVRVGPGLNDLDDLYQGVGVIHNGEEYIAFGTEKDEQGRDWWHFWFDERPAWCAAWLTINTTGNTIIETNVDTLLNVRTSPPGGSYTDIGDTYDGMRYVSDIIDSGWYRYWYGGAQRYSSGTYMIEITETETVNSTFIKPVMGFLPYWVGDDLNYSVISHLAWFGINMVADGTIDNYHGWPEWDVINEVHNEGNKVVLTVTMFSGSAIHTMLTSYKTTAVNTLLAQVEAGNADGICIDFEQPTSADKVLLVEFMQILYTTFKTARNDYHISLCTPSVDWSNAYDYDELDPYVDAFMLMGYGYYYKGSSNAGPTSPLEYPGKDLNWSVNDHLYYGVSRSKLILGLPFYGYDWPVSSTSEGASTMGTGSARTYTVVQDLIATHSPTINYNSQAECAWFNYYSGGQRQLWFDNLTSLERKFDYILDRDLGGLGIWAYGYQGIYTELEQLIYDKFITEETINYPPGAFTAFTDADSPDLDGNFYMNWSISAGADNYTVFRSNVPINTPGSGLEVSVGLVVNFSLITNMESGVYYYAVVAYNETGMTVSNNILVNVTLPFSLTSNAGNPDKDGKFTLSWDNIGSADNYSIYSFMYPITEINGTLSEESNGLLGSSYKISGVLNNTLVYYIVVAMNYTLNISSNYIIIDVLYGPPGEFSAACTAEDIDKDGNFYLTWDIPDGGSKYSIYRSNQYIYNYSENLVEVVIDTITPTQYISGLGGGIHYIIVFAFNDYGNSTSNCITVMVETPAVDAPEGFDIWVFLTSPIGLITMSIGAGSIVGLSIFLKKRHTYKSTQSEREKLEKVSAHARENTYKKKK